MLKNEDLDRPDRLFDSRDEGGDVGFVARIEPEGVRFAARRAKAFSHCLQRLGMARASRDADREAFVGEGPRNRPAEALARPDHHADASFRVAHPALSLPRA